ncbi:MAG: CpaF family protein, partial [Lachnospiraceae bacterium]|nr:CpaF family protein [Lachnospiraceae bacterium]
MDTVRNELYRRLVSGLDARDEIGDEELYGRIDRLIFQEGRAYKLSYGEMLKYRKLLFAALRGLDVLALPMEDPLVTEIMVNGPEDIYLEKEGRITRFDDRFSSPDKLSDVVQAIASRVNRRINEASPMVDARLSDGSRVNVVIPPVAIDGPCVTIRRFPENPMSMEDLIRIGSVTEECAAFLRKLVEARYNIFISGGTGAGKTTFLGALSGFIPEDERVITIEDSA